MNMKKIIFASVLVLCAAGCRVQKIEVLEPPAEQSQKIGFGSFSDETYIWENWTYTTNRVVR